jgi:hypothetical protein
MIKGRFLHRAWKEKEYAKIEKKRLEDADKLRLLNSKG